MSLQKARPLSPFVFVFLTIFIDFMGASLLVPVLPFLVDRFRSEALAVGLDLGATIGLLTASFSIAQFLATPVLGSLSDRYGRRPVLLICIFGTAVGYFIFGWATSLWVLFFSRVIDGVTGGVISTAQAYVADVSPPEERTKNFALVGVAFGLGFILGPALGGLLARVDLLLPVFFAGSIALANTVFGFFTLKESLPVERRRALDPTDFNPFRQLGVLFANPKLQGLLTGFFLFNFAFAGFTSIFALSIRDRFGWGPDLAAGLFAFIGLVSTFVQGFLIRKLLPVFGEKRLAAGGLAVIALAFVGITLAPRGEWLYLTQAMVAFGVGVSAPSLRGLLSVRVSSAEQGRILGGSQALVSISQIFGPAAAGWSYDHLGRLTPFWAGAFLLVVAVGWVITTLRGQAAEATVP
jgi:multidrug resistance protein